MAVFRSPNSPPGATPSPGSCALISIKKTRGFTLIELILVIGIISIMAVLAIPMLGSFIQVSQTRGAAQELVTILNHARQLAITKNSSHSVEVQVYNAIAAVDPPQNRLRFCSGTTVPCPASAVWIGAGTDGNGWIKLVNDARIVCITTVSANLVFSSLGAATTAGTLKVQNSQQTSSGYVKVSVSGRIRTDNAAACP